MKSFGDRTDDGMVRHHGQCIGNDLNIGNRCFGGKIGAVEGFEDMADFTVGVMVFVWPVQVRSAQPGGPEIEKQEKFDQNRFNGSALSS